MRLMISDLWEVILNLTFFPLQEENVGKRAQKRTTKKTLQDVCVCLCVRVNQWTCFKKFSLVTTVASINPRKIVHNLWSENSFGKQLFAVSYDSPSPSTQSIHDAENVAVTSTRHAPAWFGAHADTKIYS